MSKAGGGDAAADGDKKFTILFDTSKKEMLNPNQGYKKIVQKLKTRYKCEINKTDLNLKRMKECDLLLLGGPRLPFNANELQDIRRYVDEGGRVLLLMSEGGEQKLGTNINAMLE